jgi:hypothetical protein
MATPHRVGCFIVDFLLDPLFDSLFVSLFGFLFGNGMPCMPERARSHVTTEVLASARGRLIVRPREKTDRFFCESTAGCDTFVARGGTPSVWPRTTDKKKTKIKKKKKTKTKKTKKVAANGSHGTDDDGLALTSGRPVITIVNRAFDDSFFD